MRNRNHYRQETNGSLITEAKINPNAELAIVLAERLEEGEMEIKAAYWARDHIYD